MNLSYGLGIAAGILQLLAFAIYNRNINKSKIGPNTSTWTLWAFLTILSASSYMVMTGDLAKYILSVVSAVATIATFIYALVAGKFRKIKGWDWPVMLIATLAGLVWLYYKSAKNASLIITAAVALSFWPLYKTVWKKPQEEKELPWYIWTSAYATNTIVVIMRWKNQWEDLVYPVCMFFLHLGVGILVRRKPTI